MPLPFPAPVPPPKPPRVQVPLADVMVTAVAVNLVTGAREAPALGLAVGALLDVEAAVAVTQAPTFTAAAVVVSVCEKVVLALKLTVTWPFCVLCT